MTKDFLISGINKESETTFNHFAVNECFLPLNRVLFPLLICIAIIRFQD